MSDSSDPSALLATLSGIFLILIFIVSLWALRQVQAPKAETKKQPPASSSSKALSEVERNQLKRRLERETARINREEEEQRRKDALETAKPSFYEDKLRKREQQRMLQETAEENEKQIRERNINAQYSKWKTQITVVDGSRETISHLPASVEEFIAHLTHKKRIEIETVASLFRLSVDQVLARIAALENQGRLFGIIDDQARYLQISVEEMTGIKNVIDQFDERLPINELHYRISKSISIGSL
jgi:hypothetical protein